ncbi:unnamed protein product [Acanthoscelides obtectus]|uniref:Uncharacterized protein n=1 Tax=Acanthoscelides obtectus TaxID=200917 RepID=A0A9P0LSC8_ACAOB|nr:unnamed protein product [Acanthoscelides obtectus]CAK1669081.1 hypothetical protein AOBTE_LOCUS26782 [Acanthoscelides obtectus]
MRQCLDKRNRCQPSLSRPVALVIILLALSEVSQVFIVFLRFFVGRHIDCKGCYTQCRRTAGGIQSRRPCRAKEPPWCAGGLRGLPASLRSWHSSGSVVRFVYLSKLKCRLIGTTKLCCS